ncbi:MAG: hypothetical protein QOH01_2616 [Verrucomicrobiota bacterium]
MVAPATSRAAPVARKACSKIPGYAGVSASNALAAARIRSRCAEEWARRIAASPAGGGSRHSQSGCRCFNNGADLSIRAGRSGWPGAEYSVQRRSWKIITARQIARTPRPFNDQLFIVGVRCRGRRRRFAGLLFSLPRSARFFGRAGRPPGIHLRAFAGCKFG